MPRVDTAIVLALAVTVAAPSCIACTMIIPVIEVGPDFRVRVEDRGRPVSGLRVIVDAPGASAAAVTNASGIAHFRGVRPGTHRLRTDQPAGATEEALAEVKAGGPRDRTIPLSWSKAAPLRVRSLKGSIRGPGHLPASPQPPISLALWQRGANRVMRSIETPASGEFDFGVTEPGVYLLSVRLEPAAGDRAITVEVDRHAEAEQLDLDVGWSSCGLWYADRSHCPRQPDLLLTELSGRVVDFSDAGIPNASVFLLDFAGTVVERLSTDSAGKFASPKRSLTGDYRLLVTSANAGFTPLRGTVRVATAREFTGSPPTLTVQLGVLGACGAANLH